jgi:hypothetical protein
MRNEVALGGVAPAELAPKRAALKEVALKQAARAQGNTMSLTKPMLGLAVGGTLGLLDGLSGFLEPSLAPVMGSVITFSLLKGLVAGVAIGYVSQRFHSMLVGILAGIGIASALSLLVVLDAGMALFLDIMLPGMLLGVVVGFTTQKFGRQAETPPAAR